MKVENSIHIVVLVYVIVFVFVAAEHAPLLLARPKIKIVYSVILSLLLFHVQRVHPATHFWNLYRE